MTREIPLPTPGEILNEEWLKPLKLSQYALAKALAVPPRRINEIVKGQRAITADTAVRLAAYFNTDVQSWINLQTQYDEAMAREKIGEAVLREIRRLGAAVGHGTE
jgi:antitoxin HigA-1